MAAVAQASADRLAGPDKTAATQRMRLVSPAQLAAHTSPKSLWVSYKGHVYDLTEFAPDHPGGDDLVLDYAGKDVEEIMEDPVSHSHSTSAFDILREHLVGRLPATAEEHAALADAKSGGADFSGKDDDIVITADFHPDDTDVSGDFAKHAFLDLNKPLLAQVWNSSFSKEFYLQQVHSPRHLKESARLFGSDFLEMFTRTPWYVVPLVWAPIAAALFHRSASQFAAQAAARLGASTVSSSAAPAASSAVASGLRSVLGSTRACASPPASSSGRSSSTCCTASSSTSTTICPTAPSSSCCTSCCTASTTTCPWTGESPWLLWWDAWLVARGRMLGWRASKETLAARALFIALLLATSSCISSPR
jgi:cytochrome b involved in lipid metabolism